jgi:hypothetical protein
VPGNKPIVGATFGRDRAHNDLRLKTHVIADFAGAKPIADIFRDVYETCVSLISDRAHGSGITACIPGVGD